MAAKLDVAQIGEISKVQPPDIFERPIYAGDRPYHHRAKQRSY